MVLREHCNFTRIHEKFGYQDAELDRRTFKIQIRRFIREMTFYIPVIITGTKGNYINNAFSSYNFRLY